jgi:hypothetical protein
MLVRPTELAPDQSLYIRELINYQFDDFVSTLKRYDVEINIFDSVPNAPASVFPNNWVSSHVNQKTNKKIIVLYPMENFFRRLERDSPLMDYIYKDKSVIEIIDLTDYELVGRFLESTGSLVLDRVNKIAYCGVAEKTNGNLAMEWSHLMKYTVVEFETIDWDRKPVYHTNILMSIGEQYVIICPDVIASKEDRKMVLSSLRKSGRRIIRITKPQLHNFCGNCLQVRNKFNGFVLCLSKKAYESFYPEQLKLLKSYCSGGLVVVEYSLLEHFGGGSIRCSLLEYGF